MPTKTVDAKKVTAPIAHVLADQVRLDEIIKRLNRAQGQLGGIVNDALQPLLLVCRKVRAQPRANALRKRGREKGRGKKYKWGG